MVKNYELLEQYKEQRRVLQEYINKKGKQIKEIDFNSVSNNYDAYYDSDYYNNIYYKEQRLSNLNWMLNNLNYTIEWLEKGHEPGRYNGVENRFIAGLAKD